MAETPLDQEWAETLVELDRLPSRRRTAAAMVLVQVLGTFRRQLAAHRKVTRPPTRHRDRGRRTTSP